MASEKGKTRISEATVRRLSGYLRTLGELLGEGRHTVSSEDLAGRCGTTSAQIRKDLSSFGSFGRRGIGYQVDGLDESIRRILGLDRPWKVLLVGAGNLGHALFHYKEFRRQGFRFHAIFDEDTAKEGMAWEGVPVQAMDRITEEVSEKSLQLAVIAVPAESAQEVADRLVEAGVEGILNFAPVKLRLPDQIYIRDVNLAVDLEGLSYQLNRRSKLTAF